MATSDSQQFPFFLTAALEQAERLERDGSADALRLATVMRQYEATFRAWVVEGRPDTAPLIISDFLTANRVVMDYLANR